MDLKSLLAAALVVLLLSGCKIELSTTPGGRISTASGNFSCLPDQACPTITVRDTLFDETFVAVPDTGFVFDGWRKRHYGFCGGRTDDCRLGTSGFAGNDNLIGVLESDRTFYLEAVFRPQGVSGTALALAEEDRPATSPCPSQEVLTDPQELASFRDAVLNGALAFRDVPFSSGDPDNFKKKCGLEEFWDPAANTNDISPMNVGITSVTISQLLSNGNAGICATGSSPSNFLSGFPQAGTYRTEFRAAKGGANYLVRLRSTVTGSAAGNEFLTESISSDDIENTLQYRVNGQVAHHPNVLESVLNALNSSGDAIQLDVLRSANDDVILSIAIEVICVAKS